MNHVWIVINIYGHQAGFDYAGNAFLHKGWLAPANAQFDDGVKTTIGGKKFREKHLLTPNNNYGRIKIPGTHS